ncbi:hypothetical protein GCM10020001_009220 [Nonomuraea salmonea]
MLAAVELLPGGGVGETVVGAAVDHQRLVAELGGDGGGVAVRQGQEDHVVAGERLGGGLLDHAVGERGEVGLVGAERATGAGGGGERADLELGMSEEEAEQLPLPRSHWLPRSLPSFNFLLLHEYAS